MHIRKKNTAPEQLVMSSLAHIGCNKKADFLGIHYCQLFSSSGEQITQSLNHELVFI